jgi:hypothetical protein
VTTNRHPCAADGHSRAAYRDCLADSYRNSNSPAHQNAVASANTHRTGVEHRGSKRANPTINGRLSEGEWDGARVVPLTNGGQLYLMHADGYLFLGIRGKEESSGSVCQYVAGEVLILHASAGYTTSSYSKGDEDWQLRTMFIGTYYMQLPESLWQDQHLEDYGWTASVFDDGNPGELEYQIAVPEGETVLAVASVFGLGDATFLDFETWPDNLDDDCGRMGLAAEVPDTSSLRFAPEHWARIIMVEE